MIKFFKDKYRFLGNFYFSTLLYQGTFWKTVEHAFQAAKCKDLDDCETIRTTDSPGEVKKIGRKVELRPDWEEVKIDVMTDLVLLKFQNKELKSKLLETGEEYLEEGNYWHDNFWGNCYCDKCKNIIGQNVLGIILMEIRVILSEKELNGHR
jgi:ribA/ribD-fused uncharacterized protein